jgi:hypothetical protein
MSGGKSYDVFFLKERQENDNCAKHVEECVEKCFIFEPSSPA